MLTSLEHTITSVAARCIRANVPIERDTPFELLGLDSLATIELAAALETELGYALPPEVLMECPTARALAARLSREGLTRSSDDPFELMFTDAALPDDVRPVGGVEASTDLCRARTILLTGATGFLGGALLEELLQRAPAAIVCLARPGRRIVDSSRVRRVEGDLAHPRLGLSEARFDALAREVDTIVHCGAAVNWVYSYAGLRAANVAGTLELLRLACRAGAAFHFVSSLSVCYAAGGPRTVDEDFDPLSYLRGLHLGYAQTKAVGEALVREAGMRGLPVRIYRPALISGHSITGAYNGNDLIATLVRGCVAMGTAPDLDWKLDAQPVDVVARAIVALSKCPGPAFHVVHPRPRHWRECVLWMRMYGYDVRLVSYPAWLRQLERETKAFADHPLRPLRSFFTDHPPGARGLTLPELYEERRRTVALSRTTQHRLLPSGVATPPLDASLLDTYFAAFITAGDLPVPAGSPVGRVVRPGPAPHRAVTDVIRSALPEARRIEILSSGSDHSIVSELTAWRSRRPSGLFRVRVTMAGCGVRDVMVKLKACDDDVIAVGEAVADLVDPAVSRAYRQWRGQVGFAQSHAREIAIYRQEDPRFHRHAPEVLATTSDESTGTWMAVLEDVRDARRLDSAGERWTAEDLARAIDGLAALQSIWCGREAELRAQPWIGHVHSARSMTDMAELWLALAQHAAPFFASWAEPELAAIHRRLVDRIPDWWSAIETGPRTLIHNDFNPRNLCLRAGDGRLCAYDWELATVGAPQRDLAEFLCFALAPGATEEELTHWVERHRRALARETEMTIDPAAWSAGFTSALCDFLVNRLSIYAMVHRVRPQSFLPRVVRCWRGLARHAGVEAVA